MNFIGDLLITFNTDNQPGKKRLPAQPWVCIQEDVSWKLLIQKADPGWKGFPFQRFNIEDFEIFLLGELFGLQKQPNALESLLSSIFLGSGEPSELNGHFLLLAWDALSLCWHVWTNRFASLHIYHAHDGQRSAISTYFLSASSLASRRKLDGFGLACFFNFGFFPQSRTYFDDVKVLQPASEYIFDENGSIMQQNRYWNWQYQPNLTRSHTETINEFGSIFQQIVADQSSSGSIALPISGGLDSRTIAGLLSSSASHLKNSTPIWAYSYGYAKNSAETRIARQVAAHQNFDFDSYVIKPYLFERLDRVMSSLEGFNDITMCRQAGIVDEISQHADYLLGGHLGDLVLDDAGLSSVDPGSMTISELSSYALQKIRRKGTAWINHNIVNSIIGEPLVDNLLQQFASDELEKLNEITDYDFRIKVFKIEQYCFRFTATGFRMYQPAAFIRLPFYDTRLVDWICTVPTKFIQNRRLQVDFLKQAAPDLAYIPWQVYDANLYAYQHFNTWLVPKRIVKKAWRMLLQERVKERNWEVQFLCPEGKSGLQRWLQQPGLRIHEFVSPKAIQKLLQNFYGSPQPDLGYTVSMLLTFSTWLELHA